MKAGVFLRSSGNLELSVCSTLFFMFHFSEIREGLEIIASQMFECRGRTSNVAVYMTSKTVPFKMKKKIIFKKLFYSLMG